MVMSGMTSSNQRISESVRFMNWGFRAWQAHPIVAKGKQVSTAEVQMGDAGTVGLVAPRDLTVTVPSGALPAMRSEEHTSELQSLIRISYAVFCLKKTKTTKR